MIIMTGCIIRYTRKVLIKKGLFFEAKLEYTRYQKGWNDYYHPIKDRKSQKRLLPPHLRIKRIPKALEIKI